MLHAQGTRRMAISLQHAQHAWQALAQGGRGTALGPPVGSPLVTSSQHTVRIPAGTYTFRVTQFLPPSSSNAPQPGEKQAVDGVVSCDGPSMPDLARRAASGGGSGMDAERRGTNDDVAARRPCVAFLHGFLGAGRDWAAVAGALALTCRCFAIVLPGHGASRALPGSGVAGARPGRGARGEQEFALTQP